MTHGAPNIETASLRDTLWHAMREDLAKYAPEIRHNDLLMCCCCGRLLPRQDFDLEHLIPRQVLKRDPIEVRENRETPANVRARNLLLCRKPLKIKGAVVHEGGCNSWKGKHYDPRIADLLVGDGWTTGRSTQVHLIAALILAYLAAVAEFGYVIVLMESGRLMREQFFSPFEFRPAVPMRSQILFGGTAVKVPPNAPLRGDPFRFTLREGACIVTTRTYGVTLPLTHDPLQPLSRHLRFVPQQYKLRPDFVTVFD